jgi:imidazolonepropionase-like amidohydrolase
LKRPFVSVAKNGQLLPEVKEVIAVIAKHQLVLETGHSSPAEGLMLLAEGKKQGVQHMLVTHAANQYTLEQLQQATKLGGMVEVVYSSIGITPDAKPQYPPAAAADLFRKVGVDWVVISSDLGQPANPAPPEGFAEYMSKLAAAGMTPQELKKMSQDNPARLLGIPVK